MAGARWLPNTEDFFVSLENYLRRAIQISANCDLENSHYWVARLENVEELLSLFYARVYEADSNRQYVLRLINDLLEDVRSLRIQFSQIALRTAETNEQLDLDVLHPINGAPLQYTGEVGRPSFRNVISESQLRFLHDNLGLCWVDIARCLGVSERTLRRWRYQFGLTLNRNFTNMSNEQLDGHVRDILQSTPNVGLSLTRGALCARGYNMIRTYNFVL